MKILGRWIISFFISGMLFGIGEHWRHPPGCGDMFCEVGFPIAYMNGGSWGHGGWFHRWALIADLFALLALTCLIFLLWRMAARQEDRRSSSAL